MLEVNGVLCTLRWNLKIMPGLCVFWGGGFELGVGGARGPKIKPVLFGYTT